MFRFGGRIAIAGLGLSAIYTLYGLKHGNFSDQNQLNSFIGLILGPKWNGTVFLPLIFFVIFLSVNALRIYILNESNILEIWTNNFN